MLRWFWERSASRWSACVWCGVRASIRPSATLRNGSAKVWLRSSWGGLWVVTIAPGWLWRRTIGRAAARPTAPQWVSTTSGEAASPVAGRRRSLGARLIRLAGIVVVFGAVDLSVGIGWQAFTRSQVTEPVAARLGLHRDGTERDPRADLAAMGGAPWAASHFRDMQRLPQAYWPQVLTKPRPYASDTVHISGWQRRSYQPSVDDEAPAVWFFGGSTTFGEAQRDEHTIPSEIARIAAEAGTPIRVVNYGQRSWTAWQEALLFEQLSSGRRRPDLVVFYDGANEVFQQRQDSTAGWPTQYNVDNVARKLTGSDAGAGTGDTHFIGSSFPAAAADWYSGHSMALRVGRGVAGFAGVEPEPGRDRYASDASETEIGQRAATVYARARTFVSDTADARGIKAQLYWQPVPRWRTEPAYVTATEAVRGGSILVPDALDDHQDTYVDQVHTNERGARLVAERMWLTLGPAVAELP